MQFYQKFWACSETSQFWSEESSQELYAGDGTDLLEVVNANYQFSLRAFLLSVAQTGRHFGKSSMF